MEPTYFAENRYSYQTSFVKSSIASIYATETPEGDFENDMQNRFNEGQEFLKKEECTLALQKFQEVMTLILRTVHPTLPIDIPIWDKPFVFPNDNPILDVLLAKSVDILRKTPVPNFVLPATIGNLQSTLPSDVAIMLQPFTAVGLKDTSFQQLITPQVNGAVQAAMNSDWNASIKFYESALSNVPDTEEKLRGSLLHDLAIVSEKAGNKQKAQEFATMSVKSFESTKDTAAQAEALSTVIGIMNRAGLGQQTVDFSKRLDTLRSSHNLNPIISSQGISDRSRLTGATTIGRSFRAGESSPIISLSARTIAPTSAAFSFNEAAPELMGNKFIESSNFQKSITIDGISSSLSLHLDNNSLDSAREFMTSLSSTKDLGLLTSWRTPAQFIAYIPHLYFYVIPMSIGDCHYGMGNFEQAATTYQSVLSYPFINLNFEAIKTWQKLAQTYLDMGDQLYRNSKDDVANYTQAKNFYEKIVLSNRTINTASTLYSSSAFAGITVRISNFLQSTDVLDSAENPGLTSIVLNALSKLQQIAAGLNFFGFGPDYTPPFSFEYLQNTARYFAQQASQTEQRYIQYKSQAENEEFRREQLNQQAAVAHQSVILEQRGVDEAQKGIDVATAGVNYATAQLNDAQAAQNDFNNAAPELRELAEIEAWANASAVDHDDEVKLTISGFQYFQSDSENRNTVLQRLAAQRARLSQQLEENKLGRAITTAQSYQAVTNSQLEQANARKEMALQRVQIAQLQERQAQENRDFLDMREFGANLWYELSQQAKRIKKRYLDMATEISFLMERAYNAETERNLHVINYDYEHTGSGNLMGADLLMADIDYFSFDYVTTTKTKKIPIKKMISISDNFPLQFNNLKTKGKCSFETVLEDFDRDHPGFYLAKIRNVELVFVGISGTGSFSGTLRNIGVSRFRRPDGSIISRMYPADVMALSQYEIRQDALAFRFTPNDLRLFENNGIDTLWQLNLPMSANDFDYSEILDIQLILYYDGFFSPELEAAIINTLPSTGSASNIFSMRLSEPDELFYLKNKGEAEITFDATLFPRNHVDLSRISTSIIISGEPAVVNNLNLRMTCNSVTTEINLKTGLNGEINDIPDDSPLKMLQMKPFFDTWKLKITAEDNPQLLQNGILTLAGLKDVQVISQYKFNYR